jgi:Mg-chelatase subunit ChlD
MNTLRTLEVIAKYIGERTGLRVHLQPDVVPHADPATMEMWLPTNVTEDHIFPAVALAMHEAGHIKHTRYDAKEIVSNEDEFGVLNALEDARIDAKNFGLLPNIKSFYKELYAHLKDKNKKLEASLPPEPLALCDCIMRYEGFHAFASKRPDVKPLTDAIEPLFHDGVYYLDAGAFDKVRETIQKILAILNASTPQQAPGDGQGQDKNSGESPSKKSPDKGNNQAPGSSGKQSSSNLRDTIERLTRNSSMIKTDPLKRSVGNLIDPMAMTTSTRNRFEEMLKIKEEKLIAVESGALDTENLTAFFTEDIQELFSDSKIQRPKKSRVILVLDSSGSMMAPLWDGMPRYQVVKAAAKSVIESIESVNKCEGLCVDWEIAAFEATLIPLKRESWEYDYYPQGRTNIVGAFQEAQERLIKDLEITGNKIILFITDGEVKQTAVDALQDLILRNNSQIKLVIVGIGADPAGQFCKQVVENRNILDASMADQVLFEAISLCLD